MILKRFAVEGDYMWCSKEFIYFHYTIIQVVTSNHWTHSCNILSLTDTDLLHNDVVENSFPQGKILNIDWSSQGGVSLLTMEKSGTFKLLFLRINWNHIKHIQHAQLAPFPKSTLQQNIFNLLDTCTFSIFRILFRASKTRFSIAFYWHSREDSLVWVLCPKLHQTQTLSGNCFAL